MSKDEAREAFRQLAWGDFVQWARRQPEIVSQFREETGIDLDARLSPLAAEIDRVVGKTGHDLGEFILWVTENLWGVDEAPETLREEIQRRQAARQ